MTQLSNSLANRDIENFLHPYTNLAAHQETGPLVITKGDGVYVYDEAGNKYIEGLAGLWCTALGFDNKRLVEAATKAMEQLPFYHSFGSKSHPTAIDLAERLIELAPVPMSKVFFANSGSEANDTAVKIIWYINNARGRTEKKKIIAREKAYHGVTLMTASLTGLSNNHRDFDLPLDRVLHTDCPHHYHFGEDGESEEEFATRCAENLRKLILDEGPE
ncbi:MAG: aminotransferase class III-fold pyridoxal phosphate-dependent enzyme, partial [Rhodospirillales bacterium]|nr:aminotransferase class III-fold pyridoxal phosphate-dependent enzyme [Rhodospirillales bacterium]